MNMTPKSLLATLLILSAGSRGLHRGGEQVPPRGLAMAFVQRDLVSGHREGLFASCMNAGDIPGADLISGAVM